VSAVFAQRLRELAATDREVAPLALIQAEAVDVAEDHLWRAAVPDLAADPPWLDGATIYLAPERLRSLMLAMGANVSEPLPLVEASVAQQAERLASLADAATAVVAQVASLPLLWACGAAAGERLQGLVWEHGWCPVCAAWPTLLEVRGLERQRWLRCGRCGSGWRQINALCPFCGTDEYRSQTFLAPEAERDTRQAQACSRCQGYTKALTTLSALHPAELLLRDLLTLELDVAALDQGYARPERPFRELRIRLEPLPTSAARSA
jgi:FdhE protein